MAPCLDHLQEVALSPYLEADPFIAHLLIAKVARVPCLAVDPFLDEACLEAVPSFDLDLEEVPSFLVAGRVPSSLLAEDPGACRGVGLLAFAFLEVVQS